MNRFTFAVLVLGMISNAAFAQSAKSLNYRIVGAGYLKDRSFVAIIQNDDNTLSPAPVICGAGSYYPFTGNERIYISSPFSKRPSSSEDMTQADCEMKIQSMRKATLQNPVIISVRVADKE